MSGVNVAVQTERIPFLFVPGLSDIIPADGVQHFIDGEGRNRVRDYNLLGQVVAQFGLELIIEQPDWSGTTPDQWISNLEARANQAAAPGKPVILGGFSVGAFVGAKAAENLETQGSNVVRVAAYIGVSLTQSFGTRLIEARKIHPEHYTWFAGPGDDGRIPAVHPEALDQLSAKKLPYVRAPAQLYLGDEGPVMEAVSNEAIAYWPNATLIRVPEGLHDVGAPPDLAKLRAHLGDLFPQAS